MADLYPGSFKQLLRRVYYEYRQDKAIFDLPVTKFYRPNLAVDTGVTFHQHHAGTPLGPAAGPHTQLCQNILLSWLGGSRIIELKTVQVLDQLKLHRPCIDIPNIGFNIEWSQELLLDLSLREYVKASMMVDILRHAHILGEETPPSRYDTIFDMSVGYDLKGIRCEQVTGWIRSLMDASAVVNELRAEIPEEYAQYRDLDFRTRISDSVTLSTFHGCPKDEIEKIGEYILSELGLNLVIKLNPTQLGKAELENILWDKLGYTELKVTEKSYTSGMSLAEACEMIKRLEVIAQNHDRELGVKFSNTLEVANSRDVFKQDECMYMSGTPLHVLAMQLAERFRQSMGPEMTISFSAGIDKYNFTSAVAAGLIPVTVCTDLLKTGGYSRLAPYLHGLEQDMLKLGVKTIREYIKKLSGNPELNVLEAARLNLKHYVKTLLDDPRYKKENNTATPKKIDSHLKTFDCISCDKCIPVCPNDANFYYESEPVEIASPIYLYKDGELILESTPVFTISKKKQIANYADFCNECGNCDTYCPENGGPYIEKPSIFGTLETWKYHQDHDGFYVEKENGNQRIWGRIQENEYYLEITAAQDRTIYHDQYLDVIFKSSTHEIMEYDLFDDPPEGYRFDYAMYHTLRILLTSLLDTHRIHYVNIPHS